MNDSHFTSCNIVWFYNRLYVPTYTCCLNTLTNRYTTDVQVNEHAYCCIYQSMFFSLTSPQKRQKLSRRPHTNTHIHRSVFFSVSRAESERNPWVVLNTALLTRCQGSEVRLDLGQQVVNMVRSLYNTKHKLPTQVNGKLSYNCLCLLCSNLKSSSRVETGNRKIMFQFHAIQLWWNVTKFIQCKFNFQVLYVFSLYTNFKYLYILVYSYSFQLPKSLIQSLHFS